MIAANKASSGAEAGMEDDDLQPRVRLAEGRPLESFSVEELRTYADRLNQELEQVRAMMNDKEQHRSGADSLFKF